MTGVHEAGQHHRHRHHPRLEEARGTAPLSNTVAVANGQVTAQTSPLSSDQTKTTVYQSSAVEPKATVFPPVKSAGNATPVAQVPDAQQQLKTLSAQVKEFQDKLQQLEKQGAPSDKISEIRDYISTLEERLAGVHDLPADTALHVLDESYEDLDFAWAALNDLGKMKTGDGKPVADPKLVSDLKEMVNKIEFETLDDLECMLEEPAGTSQSQLEEIRDNLQIVYDIEPDVSRTTPEGQKRALAEKRLKELGVTVVVNKFMGFDWLAADDYVYAKDGVCKKFSSKEALLQYLTEHASPTSATGEPADHLNSSPTAGEKHDHAKHDHDFKVLGEMTQSALLWDRVDAWAHVLEQSQNKLLTEDQLKDLGIARTVNRDGKTVYQYPNDPKAYSSVQELATARLQDLKVTASTDDKGQAVFSFTDHTGRVSNNLTLKGLTAACRVSAADATFMPAFQPTDTVEQKIDKIKEQLTKNEQIVAKLNDDIKAINRQIDKYVKDYDQRMALLTELQQQPPPPPFLSFGFVPIPNPRFLAWQAARKQTIDQLAGLGVQVRLEGNNVVYEVQTAAGKTQKFTSTADMDQFLKASYEDKLNRSYERREKLNEYVRDFYSPCTKQLENMLRNYEAAQKGGEDCLKALEREGIVPDQRPVNRVYAKKVNGKVEYYLIGLDDKHCKITPQEALMRVAEASAREQIATTALNAPEKSREIRKDNTFLAQLHQRVVQSAQMLQFMTKLFDPLTQRGRTVRAILEDVRSGKITPNEAERRLRELFNNDPNVQYKNGKFTINNDGEAITFDLDVSTGKIKITLPYGGDRTFSVFDTKELLKAVQDLNDEGKEILYRMGLNTQESGKIRRENPDNKEIQDNDAAVREETAKAEADMSKLREVLAQVLTNSGMPRDQAYAFLADKNPDLDKYAMMMSGAPSDTAPAAGQTVVTAPPADHDQGAAAPAARPGEGEAETTERRLHGSLFARTFTQEVAKTAEAATEADQLLAEKVEKLRQLRQVVNEWLGEQVRQRQKAEERELSERAAREFHAMLRQLGLSPKDLTEVVHDIITNAPQGKDRKLEV